MADEEADKEPGEFRRVKSECSSGTHLFLREFRCGIRVPKKSCSFRATFKRVHQENLDAPCNHGDIRPV